MTDEEILNELISVKGIGVKTASCVLLFSLDRNICARVELSPIDRIQRVDAWSTKIELDGLR